MSPGSKISTIKINYVKCSWSKEGFVLTSLPVGSGFIRTKSQLEGTSVKSQLPACQQMCWIQVGGSLYGKVQVGQVWTCLGVPVSEGVGAGEGLNMVGEQDQGQGLVWGPPE